MCTVHLTAATPALGTAVPKQRRTRDLPVAGEPRGARGHPAQPRGPGASVQAPTRKGLRPPLAGPRAGALPERREVPPAKGAQVGGEGPPARALPWRGGGGGGGESLGPDLCPGCTLPWRGGGRAPQHPLCALLPLSAPSGLLPPAGDPASLGLARIFLGTVPGSQGPFGGCTPWTQGTDPLHPP